MTTEENSYRIATAVFRFAASLGDTALARSFQEHATILLDRAVAGEPPTATRALRNIAYLARFAAEVGIMSKEDADLLRKATDSHARELAASTEKPAQRPNLAHFLPSTISGQNAKPITLPAKKESVIRQTQPPTQPAQDQAKKESGNPAMRQRLPDAGEDERKEIILSRIRQSGNARLKEILDAVPNLSERTLRYALQRLIEEGKIERVGNGGAGSYYQAVSQQIQASAPAPVKV